MRVVLLIDVLEDFVTALDSNRDDGEETVFEDSVFDIGVICGFSTIDDVKIGVVTVRGEDSDADIKMVVDFSKGFDLVTNVGLISTDPVCVKNVKL